MEEVTTSLFDGVTAQEYNAMMTCFKTTTRGYGKGEEIPMPSGRIGVVQSGKLSLIKTDVNGVRTIFEQLKKGGVFGDVLGFSWADANFYLSADEDCEILYIDYEHIIKRCPNACTHHSVVVANLVQLMSEKTQALSEHLEILSRRTIREKLSAYFRCWRRRIRVRILRFRFADEPCGLYMCGSQRDGAGTETNERRRTDRTGQAQRKTAQACGGGKVNNADIYTRNRADRRRKF